MSQYYEETTAYSATMAAMEEQRQFLERAHETDPEGLAVVNTAYLQLTIATTIAILSEAYGKLLNKELSDRHDRLRNRRDRLLAQLEMRHAHALRENQEARDAIDERHETAIREARDSTDRKLAAIAAPIGNGNDAELLTEEQLQAELDRLGQSKAIKLAYHEEFTSIHNRTRKLLSENHEQRMRIYDDASAARDTALAELNAEYELIENERAPITENLNMLWRELSTIREAYKTSFFTLHLRNGVMPAVIQYY
jgi:hypothetical protein